VYRGWCLYEFLALRISQPTYTICAVEDPYLISQAPEAQASSCELVV
jgi:hypothetical protein